MAPAAEESVGPHPSYVEVAKPYLFGQTIENQLSQSGLEQAKESNARLQGVAWIDGVRRALQLPVKTFNTAVVYYHKFRLIHGDSASNFADAAAAALFTACKIEDTLKKSREILCAAYNLKLSPADQLSPDDPRFDISARSIIVLERLMLESSSFDFRSRHPQRLLIKLAKAYNLPKDTVGKTAYNLSLDLYRTFAPLKQTTSTMAVACLELAVRLHNLEVSEAFGQDGGIDYQKWSTTRAEVMETLFDLLDLFIHHRPLTSVGPQYPLEAFIGIRIPLNQESAAANFLRYTESEWVEQARPSPSTHTNGIRPRNGALPASPTTPQTPGTVSPRLPNPSAIGLRGQHGTVRFMLDAARAREERKEVDAYRKAEEEEYEVEVPIESERRRAR